MHTRRWSISAIGATTVYLGGITETRPEAWLAALAAGRAALLAGDLATLAVSVDDELEALMDPGRDAAGRLDTTAVTAELLEMYQSATTAEVLESLVAGARC